MMRGVQFGGLEAVVAVVVGLTLACAPGPRSTAGRGTGTIDADTGAPTGGAAGALATGMGGRPTALDVDSGTPCASVVHATGNAPLIDDFEDGDSQLIVADGRTGSTLHVVSRDGSVVYGSGPPALIPGGRGTSERALNEDNP